MIAKKYRLKEREVKKVLAKWKPFFSYSIVFNVFPNRLNYSRYAIVIGGKSVPNNIVRNTIRRRFYDLVHEKYSQNNYGDIVCVVKSKVKLTWNPQDLQKFSSEITYLFDKKLWKNI